MRAFHRRLAVLLLVLAFISLKAFKTHTVVYAASGCFDLVTAAPQNVKAVSGPGNGQVTLYWDQVPYATSYAISYGTSSGNYVYGVSNLGTDQTRSFTVSSLTPGVQYFFKVTGQKDCDTGSGSMEVSALASGMINTGMPIQPPARLGMLPPVSGIPSLPPPPFGTPPLPPIGYPPVPPVIMQPVVWSGPVGKNKLSAMSGPGIGEVTLYWQNADTADNNDLVYGTTSSVNQYGAMNIGKNNPYVVKGLVPGATYYFALVPVFNNRALYTSEVVQSTAKMALPVIPVNANGQVITPLPLRVMQPATPSGLYPGNTTVQPTVEVPTQTPEQIATPTPTMVTQVTGLPTQDTATAPDPSSTDSGPTAEPTPKDY